MYHERGARPRGLIDVLACGKPIVLVVDEHVPFFDRDAGSKRIDHLIDALAARGCVVVFGSIDRREYPPYTRRLRDAGAVVLTGFGVQALHEAAAAGVAFEIAWLSRPSVASLLIDVLREVDPSARIVYDTVDLHYRRLEREERATGRSSGWRSMRERELALARRADITVVTSEPEGEELVRAGIANVERFAVFERAVVNGPGWDARSGALFVGNYGHAPNADAACELVKMIMPLVRESRALFGVTLAGADPTAAVRALAGYGVDVPGYVADLSALFARGRVFVAPLRFGSGLKGKIVQALSNGVPVVTTTIGAEGFPDPAAWGLIADDAPGFARAMIRLHEDRALWERLSAGARAIAKKFDASAAAEQLDRVVRASSASRGSVRGSIAAVEDAAPANAPGEVVIRP